MKSSLVPSTPAALVASRRAGFTLPALRYTGSSVRVQHTYVDTLSSADGRFPLLVLTHFEPKPVAGEPSGPSKVFYFLKVENKLLSKLYRMIGKIFCR